ncbi:hypothetical protein Micbo1qcDRAFT_234955 [Microdochium bolleyi]|uniref:XRCC4 coiled-coil domain-containing protein n=1 Tax=Microdochium bolleyi TaxID=196109 RepID=A0A136IXK7_9PEZI|nr:hypothetical protein Micbo1qcDRAFT_234955 [Microdochium bolleyi]
MAKAPVVRFPIAGREDDFFLLEVSPHGSKPLDLKLLGTEGEAVFVTRLRHRRVVEHKSSTGHCTDAEWEAILTAALVERKQVHDIEIRADVSKDGSAVGLSFRKNIQGITQRLGSIKIPERPEDDADESNEISPFHWCVAILGERAELEGRAASSTAKIEFLEHTVNELKDQLQEFIKAKEDDESQLLEKFRDLLNEKKVKIRQQQRLLASVDVGNQTVAESQYDSKRKASASRPSKRKVDGEGAVDSSDDDDDHDDDKRGNPNAMEVDSEHRPQGDPEADEQMTTDDDDDETHDEASTESGDEQLQAKAQAAKSSSRNTRPAGRKSSPAAPAKSATRSTRSTHGIKSEPASQQADDVPPAKRELPFMRKKKNAAPPPKAAPTNDDDETGSDDEL